MRKSRLNSVVGPTVRPGAVPGADVVTRPPPDVAPSTVTRLKAQRSDRASSKRGERRAVRKDRGFCEALVHPELVEARAGDADLRGEVAGRVVLRPPRDE